MTGIDTYGTGRSPFFLEPSVIIIITDGGKLSSQQGVLDDVSICSHRSGEVYNTVSAFLSVIFILDYR